MLRALLEELDLSEPPAATEAEIALLAASVNPVRLKNSPVAIDEAAAEEIYRSLLTRA